MEALPAFIAFLLLAPTIAFQPIHRHRLDPSCTFRSCLRASSRRDLFSSVPAATAAAIAILVPSKEVNADSAPSYQGVFMDPNHPKGYRVLTGDSSIGTMQLQDIPEDSIYEIPLKIETDKILIDFSVKGGPKDVTGVVGSIGGVTTISFPDGNVWKKETGIIGVYKDGFDPALLRVIRKEKGNKFAVDLIDGIDTISISAKGGAPKVIFDFPGKPNVPGLVDPKKNTISFKDGNVWTKL